MYVSLTHEEQARQKKAGLILSPAPTDPAEAHEEMTRYLLGRQAEKDLLERELRDANDEVARLQQLHEREREDAKEGAQRHQDEVARLQQALQAEVAARKQAEAALLREKLLQVQAEIERLHAQRAPDGMPPSATGADEELTASPTQGPANNGVFDDANRNENRRASSPSPPAGGFGGGGGGDDATGLPRPPLLPQPPNVSHAASAKASKRGRDDSSESVAGSAPAPGEASTADGGGGGGGGDGDGGGVRKALRTESIDTANSVAADAKRYGALRTQLKKNGSRVSYKKMATLCAKAAVGLMKFVSDAGKFKAEAFDAWNNKVGDGSLFRNENEVRVRPGNVAFKAVLKFLFHRKFPNGKAEFTRPGDVHGVPHRWVFEFRQRGQPLGKLTKRSGTKHDVYTLKLTRKAKALPKERMWDVDHLIAKGLVVPLPPNVPRKTRDVANKGAAE